MSKNTFTLTAVLLTLAVQLHAQMLPALQVALNLTTDQYDTLIATAEQTDPLPASSLPASGNFYSVENPDWPPLPENNGLSAWDLGDGYYLLGDQDFDYSAPLLRMGGMGRFWTMDDSGYGSSGFPLFSIDTNQLWLEMITVTNQTASLVVHPPPGVTNEVYELLYCTNLLPPISWQWLLRTYPQETNLIVPSAKDEQGFYRLSSPNDLVANDSLGTNFWVGFCGLYFFNSDPLGFDRSNLSLFISSPGGATGTVISPGLLTNSPIIVVTNCGDAVVNGTYLRTNLTNQEQSDLGNEGLSGSDITYKNGTNWLVSDPDSDYWELIQHNDDTGVITGLYDKPGDADPNGTTNDWQSIDDTNLPTPTTICAKVPMIDQPFTVAAGTVTNIYIPLTALTEDYDVVETNGINIIASQPVSVYAFSFVATASTAFTGYPTTLLGTNYCVMARAASDPLSPAFSQLAIIATMDNTTVHIAPSSMANFAGFSDLTNLQAGETYQIQSQDITNDVTGTWITSDKPIVVFAGAKLTQVPDSNAPAGNPIVQEQLPVDSWGVEVLALSFAGRTNGDTYRILAAYTNTVITITGNVITVLVETNHPWTVTSSNETVVVTNQAGELFDIIVDGPVEFNASKPIQVAQFANGTRFDLAASLTNSEAEGDPCEILLPPIAHYLMTNIVATGPPFDPAGSSGFDENYLNIIVAQSAITNTLVDGLPISSTNFIAIGVSGYFGAQISVTNGVHSVISPQPVGVEVYGFGLADAYGFLGGIVK